MVTYKWNFETKPTKSMKKASEKFIEYYENQTGNKLAKYKKAVEQFEEHHQIKAPYSNYRSFESIYRYHRI